ncbi:MAG TPA: DUF72 domain-containing protein [bacterium]|nr:DUF72 domain-containing protein [bacterium]HQP98001.1 DUF72 domain-containing protein [bacterium]
MERSVITLAMDVHIGTSGYSFKDWKGVFYPATLPDRQMLSHYCQYFDTLELNVSYYRIPSPRTMENIVKTTPEDFHVWVKAHQDMTHHRGKNPDIFPQFLECIRPLQDQGKFQGVLLQFPFSFKGNRENSLYLKQLREQLGDLNLAVEFRHESWITPEVLEFLRSLNMTYCIPDEPDLPGLVPPDPYVTSHIAYVRFHGRNKQHWWRGGDRYNYEYSEEELTEWLPKIDNLSKTAQIVFLLFNNCHLGQAVRNALWMQQALS